MAKERIIDTRFWIDDYISNLDPIEKLLFLYFLTNPFTDICGVYEIPLKNIALDTGIEKEMVEKILKRFEKEKKVFYLNGWIAVVNFPKYQHSDNPKIAKGIENGLNKAPKEILDKIKIAYIYPMDRLSHLNTNTNTNTNSGAENTSLEEIIKNNMEYSYDEDIRDIRKKKKKISQEENKFLISIGILWVKKAMAYFNYKQENVPMKNIYYPIRACWERDKFTYQDFSDLFDYFLGSKIKEDDKLSFDLCMSEKYVAKYKIAKKNKKLTFAGIANEIKL